MAGLAPSVLRFWETEFSGLRPAKNRAGKRLYRQDEIDRILHLKKLLYEDRYTIEGARKVLKESGEKEESQHHSREAGTEIPKEEIQQGLKDILDLLDQ